MVDLTEQERQEVAAIAQRHGVSEQAALTLLAAIDRGGGGMAQFDHPDLGGSGQWMAGGMVMVGDMFNHGLKARVDAVCRDLVELSLRLPRRRETPHEAMGMASPAAWWPADFGSPAQSGGQNDVRYAWFPQSRRLAVSRGGTLSLYDTGDHRISGVSQQQGSRSGLVFTSQHGTIDLDALPTIANEAGSGGSQKGGEPSEEGEPGEADTVADDRSRPSPFLEIRIDIAAAAWEFDAADGRGLIPLRLLPDGAIDGGPATVSRWRVEGPCLVFLDASDRPTTRFDTVRFGGAWILSGPALDSPPMVRRLHRRAGTG